MIRRLLSRWRIARAVPEVPAGLAGPAGPAPVEAADEKPPNVAVFPAAPVVPAAAEHHGQEPAEVHASDGADRLYWVRYDAAGLLGRSNGGRPPKGFVQWASSPEELADRISQNIAPCIGPGANVLVDLAANGGQVGVGIDKLGTFSVEELHVVRPPEGDHHDV